MNVKELVKDKTVKFTHYYDGELWYEVVRMNFTFPVPVKDIGNATFMAEDKAMLFMRYIRKHLMQLKNK